MYYRLLMKVIIKKLAKLLKWNRQDAIDEKVYLTERSVVLTEFSQLITELCSCRHCKQQPTFSATDADLQFYFYDFNTEH